MSTLRFDFDKPKSDIYYMKPDATIKAQPDIIEDKIDIGEFLMALHKFRASFTPEDKNLYQQAYLLSTTTANNKSSKHIWNIIVQVFLQSLRQTYPQQDFSELRKTLESIDIKSNEKEVVDNNTFRVYLLGTLAGLLS